MMRPGFDPRWIAAARHERDWRAEAYPARIAAKKSDREQANLDYQAWCAIVEWLEAGKGSWPAIIGQWGGTANPPITVISWQLMEECAAKSLSSLDKRVAKEPGDQDLRERRDSVFCIVSVLDHQRMIVEASDRLIAQRRVERAAEAAA